jgi:hypothetical protein
VPRTLLDLIALFFSVLVVTSCAEAVEPGQSRNVLTSEERTRCLRHPEAHREAATSLGISFVGDYIRASELGGEPYISDLEPPYLAVPSSDNEALSLRLQFESSKDFDRACQATLELLE